MDQADMFGRKLERDPLVALPTPPPSKGFKSGPLHKVQYVIEFVGERSVTAATARALLTDPWFSALGQPLTYAMSPGHDHWQSLSKILDGSVDSLALAWKIIDQKGELTGPAASHLLKVAESFGAQIGRRAMPLPPPSDIPRRSHALQDIVDNLDIGVEVMLVPKAAEFAEKQVWIEAARLGFTFSSEGFFEIAGESSNCPYLTLTPMGGMPAFSLASVANGITHPGLMLGFSVPLSPDPQYSLDSTFAAADHLCASLDGAAFGDADQLLGPTSRLQMKSALMEAIRALQSAGLQSGSPEAECLFA